MADAHCSRCGEGGLVWEHQAAGWVLVTVGGHRHVCKPSAPTVIANPFKWKKL